MFNKEKKTIKDPWKRWTIVTVYYLEKKTTFSSGSIFYLVNSQRISGPKTQSKYIPEKAKK